MPLLTLPLANRACVEMSGAAACKLYEEPCIRSARYRREFHTLPSACRWEPAVPQEDWAGRRVVTQSTDFDEGIQMTKTNIYLILAAAGLALAGCNKAESPAEVQHDVSDARAEATRDVTDAQADAQEKMADAQKDVADAQADHDANDVADQARDASETAAQGDFKVAVARAEATHKIAVQKCEALQGSAQEDCKARADADLENAKRAAEARRDGAG